MAPRLVVPGEKARTQFGEHFPGIAEEGRLDAECTARLGLEAVVQRRQPSTMWYKSYRSALPGRVPGVCCQRVTAVRSGCGVGGKEFLKPGERAEHPYPSVVGEELHIIRP
jgi:hypothetical protein